MDSLRAFLNSLRTRLVLAAAVFLLTLTLAVVLVVRDSLTFAARNMAEVGAQALVDQRQSALLEIARREADLLDHAVHHNPDDLAPLHQRLAALTLMPHGFTFVLDGEGKWLAGEGQEFLATENVDLSVILQQMQAGESGATQLELEGEPLLVAFAPLPETGWVFAIVEPVSDVIANANPLIENIQQEGDRLLKATLTTIAYFAVLAIIGVILVARALTGPIQTLVDGTRSIATGDLAVRIPVKSSDELGRLAESFNQMAASLQTRTQEVIEANQVAIENARLYEQARTLATVEERQRLARELHDSVTQSLYSLTLLAEAGRRTALAGDTERVAGLVARLGQTAQQALKEMRLLVYELRPLALETEGLVGALQQRLDAVEKRAGVQVIFHPDEIPDLPPEVEHGLYRIAQEALNNALKHAEAITVEVSLRATPDAVVLEIRDNGKGFEPEAVADQGGMGLVNIRERAEALHGQWAISSTLGEGTRVWAKVLMA